MAVTSIWSVKGWLGKIVIHTENPDKTKNPDYFEKQGMTASKVQELSDVIEYGLSVIKEPKRGRCRSVRIIKKGICTNGESLFCTFSRGKLVDREFVPVYNK